MSTAAPEESTLSVPHDPVTSTPKPEMTESGWQPTPKQPNCQLTCNQHQGLGWHKKVKLNSSDSLSQEQKLEIPND